MVLGVASRWSKPGAFTRFFDLRPVNCRSEVLFTGPRKYIVDKLMTIESAKRSFQPVRRVQQLVSFLAIIHCDHESVFQHRSGASKKLFNSKIDFRDLAFGKMQIDAPAILFHVPVGLAVAPNEFIFGERNAKLAQSSGAHGDAVNR